MKTKLDVFKEARNYGSTATLAQVETVLNSVDRSAFEAFERNRYRIEIWDKVNPVNNIPVSSIENGVPTGGEVYFIYIDGNLVIIQKHDPDQSGFVPMTVYTATAKAQAQIDKMVEQTVDQKVMDECLMQLL